MPTDGDGVPDWTNRTFLSMAEELLANGREKQVVINGCEGRLLISLRGENWLFEHRGLPTNKIIVSSTYPGKLTPAFVTP